MKTKILFFSAIIVAIFLIVIIEKNIYPSSYNLHYKMTVTVETPEGIISGSAVRQISNGVPSTVWPGVGNPAGVYGEAVVVDLGKRGVLFALISSDSDHEFYNAFREYWPGGGSTPEGIAYYAGMATGTKGVLNPRNFPGYPQLVTFMDLNDPMSVTKAQIWERNEMGHYDLKDDRMEKVFGKGVKLVDITLEITDEPITARVEELLPWLPQYYDSLLDGNTIQTIHAKNRLANSLGSGSFLNKRKE